MEPLLKCVEPSGLPRASHAVQWDSSNWAVAHVDGTLSIFSRGLTSVIVHPGDRPTCLAVSDSQHVVIGFESGWVYSYDLLNGFKTCSQKLPFPPDGILARESTVVLWSGLALHTAVLRQATLAIEELTKETDVVLRVCDYEGYARVYQNRIDLGHRCIGLPSGVLDAVPGADGMWCVMWRDRWALCDSDGQEEFGAGSLGSKFSNLIKTEVGVFICCDDGSAVNVRNNNVQLLSPLPGAIHFGPRALTRKLEEFVLVADNGMHWDHSRKLFELAKPEQTCGNKSLFNGFVVGDTPLFGSPIVRIDNGRAWTFDSVSALNGLAEPTPTLQRLGLSLQTSDLDDIVAEKWYAIGDHGFKLDSSTAALAAAAGGKVPGALLKEGGVERLEDLLARLEPGSEPHSRIVDLIKDMWDSGRVAALLQSSGLRTLAVLGGAYPDFKAATSWLTSNLPAYLKSDNLDYRLVSLRIASLHPELVLVDHKRAIPLTAIKSIPEAAAEAIVQTYARTAPSQLLKILAANREFSLLASAVKTGAFAPVLDEVVAAIIPEVTKTGSAQKLLTLVKDMYPTQIKFSKQTQRLLVLCKGKLTNWNLGGSRHLPMRLEAADAIKSVDFSSPGDAVLGTLEDGKHVRWTFPNALESLFKRDHLDAEYVN